MRFVATMALAALVGLQGTSSHAQPLDRPDSTVGAYLPGCRAILQNADSVGLEGAGLCHGVVDTLLYIGELLPPDYRSCVPLRIARRDIIRDIVEDLEALYPAVERQDFKGMVLEILHYRWPCRD